MFGDLFAEMDSVSLDELNPDTRLKTVQLPLLIDLVSGYPQLYVLGN